MLRSGGFVVVTVVVVDAVTVEVGVVVVTTPKQLF